MEINKVLLTEAILLSGYNSSYSTDDVVVQNTSASYADEVDESPEIVQSESKKSKKKNNTSHIIGNGVSCYGLKTINGNNADEILKNSDGKKTFIIIGNKYADGAGCGKCDSVKGKIADAASEMSDEANFVELNYAENSALLQRLKKEAGYNDSLGFPAVIVCDENGNPEKVLNDVYYEAQNQSKKSGITELFRNELGTSKISKQIPEKGTTFIYPHSGSDNTKFNEIAEALGSQATFLNLDVSGDYSMMRILKDMTKEAGSKTCAIGQYVIKCVDGKPVEAIPASSMYKSSKTDTSTLVNFFENKIESGGKEEKIEKLTSQNVDTNLRGTEGTTYIIVGNTGCSRCQTLAPYLNQVASNIGDDANFLELTYSKDKELLKQLKKEAGHNGSLQFPAIIKCVNGKATEVISVDQYASEVNSKDNNVADKITQKLKNKIEGTYKPNPNKKVQETSSQNDEDEGTSSLDGNAEVENATKEELVKKKELATLKENLKIMNNFIQELTTDSLEDAIQNASSISDLKDVISTYSSSLDFNTQLNLQSALDEFKEDSDLSKAKDKLLNLL